MSLARPVVEPPLDPFELTARVAHGGMATIYAGTRGGERVAVKLLHPHLAEDPHIRSMFLHEAQLAARLEHDNVVRVFDHGEHPEHGAFILMELLDGGDLAELLKAAGKVRRQLPAPIVLRLVVDLCRGLEAAHTLRGDDGAPLNLIHRDVSPHNLMVSTDGVARLTDFGIAKSDERYTMTRPGQLKGKLSYMAPEQLAHEDDLDRRVDVFAAGVVLWEALLGRRLFKAEDEISVINKVLLERVPPPSTFDDAFAPLDAVVAKALAREREDRYPTAAAMADALEGVAGDIGGLASRAEVGALVTELLSDALKARAARLERPSLTPSGIRTGSGAVTRTELPAVSPRSPRSWAWIALAVLVAAGIGAALTQLWQPAREPAATRPSPTSPAPAATPPAPPPAVVAEPSATPAPSVEPARDEPARVAPQPTLRASARRVARLPRPRREPPAGPEPATTPPRDDPPRPVGAPRDDLYPNPFRD